ncbi:F-box domain-containing protein [Plectosphaerella plurivora]|uniref:F-box domain-containing protein n=1 Tax=Plectosphaerella plurivora TaxID=936078 RepID=A0A9P9A8N8_9PEZI|nr:F-box domain-containing protein [Plectosphaerella plurivora]
METSGDLASGQPKAEAPSTLSPPAAQTTDHKQDDQRPMSPTNESATAVITSREDPAVALRKLLKGKEHEWSAAISRKQGKLTLLELPLDVLRLIVAEITHTNDLSALALTNSTLYNLAVPHIYSRFDIVWPDATQLTQSDSKNVDALTYGLSTLCLGNSFAYRAQKMFSSRPPGNGRGAMRRLHNDHASYIKKFSLGNGPDDWVAEYMINKESGKMLGTLVALAVAKMTNLETFVWDMPTGVLADIFMALASIGDAILNGVDENDNSKLQRVWVRWHDNYSEGSASATATPSPADAHGISFNGATMTSIGYLVPSTTNHPRPPPPFSYAESRVEYPTFSVLPPLKSLSVLDIDELSYLDEMALAIASSKDKLEELRVGISQKASQRGFVQPWDGPNLHQVDYNARWPGENTVGDRRLGGVLGILVGRIFDIRKKAHSKSKSSVSDAAVPPEPVAEASSSEPSQPVSTETDGQDGVGEHNPSPEGSQPTLDPTAASDEEATAVVPEPPHVAEAEGSASAPVAPELQDGTPSPSERRRLDHKLRLKTLEMERVPISVHVCVKAFDWTVLTSLTILECAQSDALWKALRKHFQPTASAHSSKHISSSHHYSLALKKIHTDRASVSLINFLKETLAPNSLEVLFLQERRPSLPPVTIDQIFKGPIKRHRSSLQKVLLDSSEYRPPGASVPESYRWLNWTATTEMILYMTSGRMRNLKELSICMHYRDWHPFLQRLPNMPHLRSLHLPKIADHVSNSDPKELALQIVDIITLRPEIQLCYVGIMKKCFEILETKLPDSMTGAFSSAQGHSGPEEEDDDDDDSDDDGSVDTSEDEAEEEQDMDGEDEDDAISSGDLAEDDDDVSVVDTASEADSFQEADEIGGVARLRVREILFYDDRVAIFKARHGRL